MSTGNEKGNKYINIGAVVLVLLLIATTAYFLFGMRNVTQGPQILINAPAEGVVVDRSVVELQGKVKNVSKISINGEPIKVQGDDRIKEQFVLQPGENTFRLTAQDKYGHSTEKMVKIIYKQQ